MSKDTVQFSPREMEVLALAWQCMESQPKIDMAKLARLTGYTPGSASVTFGNIKRKLKLLGEDLAANGPATPKNGSGPGKSKGSNPTPRKRSRTSGEDDSEVTPAKKSRKSGARKKRMGSEEDEDEEHVAPRIKKEEVADVVGGANGFFDQLQNAAGMYEFEQGVGEDD